jgi:hypothetical protein
MSRQIAQRIAFTLITAAAIFVIHPIFFIVGYNRFSGSWCDQSGSSSARSHGMG